MQILIFGIRVNEWLTHIQISANNWTGNYSPHVLLGCFIFGQFLQIIMFYTPIHPWYVLMEWPETVLLQNEYTWNMTWNMTSFILI